MAATINPLNPTFRGYVASTLDALLLFEACLGGQLNHVPRRPHDRERQELITSGNIFIYEEHASGIKRWTDGVSWSPSRILNNFLVYRELDRPFPPGEKKRALKKKRPQGIGKTDLVPRPGPSSTAELSAVKDVERALVGSLVDSYPFKNDGLVKKTISITFQGVPHHLVSYYNLSDVQSGRLHTPSKHPLCQGISPRGELIMQQNFRSPIDEIDYDDRFLMPPALLSLSLPGSTLNSLPFSNYPALTPYGFSHHGEHPSPPHHGQLLPPTQSQQLSPEDHYHLHVEHQTSLQHQPSIPRQAHLQQQHAHLQNQGQQHTQLHYQQQQQQQHHHHSHHHSQQQQQHQHHPHPHHQQQQQQQHHHHHHSQQQQQPQSQDQHPLLPHHHHHPSIQYPVQLPFVSPSSSTGLVSPDSYISSAPESYAGSHWGFEGLDRGHQYFDECHTGDNSPWWSGSNDPQTSQGSDDTPPLNS